MRKQHAQAEYQEREAKDFEHFATLFILAECTSLIWITHAQKDGRGYIGESSGAHEADIVVRCDEGEATTLKNRFGPAGTSFTIF